VSNSSRPTNRTALDRRIEQLSTDERPRAVTEPSRHERVVVEHVRKRYRLKRREALATPYRLATGRFDSMSEE